MNALNIAGILATIIALVIAYKLYRRL